MRKITRLILVGVVAVGLSSSAFAAACKPTPSDLDEAFGLGQLGQSYAELLPSIKPREFSELNSDQRCRRMDNTPYDCSFKDAEGVVYGDVGKGLIEKSIFLPGAPKARLPFSLSHGDKLNDVVKKTAPYLKRKFKIEKEGLYTYYLSGLCYTNTRGKKFSLNFHFNHEGLLTTIAVASEDAPAETPLQ